MVSLLPSDGTSPASRRSTTGRTTLRSRPWSRGASAAAAAASLILLATGAPGHARPRDGEGEPGDAAMSHVPAGRFFMGEHPSDGHDGHAGRLTTLPEFWLDRTEVTARDYQTCVAAGECPAVDTRQARCNNNLGGGSAEHPANCVEWGGAAAFCRWKGKRLPTSAEWERAARGDDERRYPWGNERPTNQLCWQRAGGSAGSCPVGSRPAGASPFGVQDMAGNVAEWTATRVPTPFGIEYVVRGGGYAVEDLAMAAPDELEYRADRSTTRDPTDAAPDLGFRCARGGGRSATSTAAHDDAAADWSEGRVPYVFTPPSTSRDHKAVIQAVRAQMTGAGAADLKVDWFKISGDWAYFEGHAPAPAAKAGGAPAAPPSGNALLHRKPDGRWEIAEILIGPESEAKRAGFRERLEGRRAKGKLPQGLFSDPGTP